MGKTFAVLLVVMALAGGGYYYYHTQLSSSFLTQKKVTINGKEYDVRSKEDCDRRGLTLRMIANKDNAAILYCKASNAWDEPKGRVRDALSDRDVTDPAFKRWYEKNKACLSLIHRAARKKDCQFPVLGKDDVSFTETPLPYPSMVRGFVQLIVCEGTLRERDGDYAKALDCYLTAHVLGDHLGRSNPCLVSKFMAVHCYARGHRAVEECVANRPLSEEELRTLVVECLARVDKCPSTRSALDDEKATVKGFIMDLVEDPDSAADVLSFMSSANPQVSAEALKRAAQRGAREHLEELDRFWAVTERWCELPAWQALQPGKDWDAYLQHSPPRSPLLQLFLPAWNRIRVTFERIKADTAGVAIFVAIKLYEKENGRPPRTLSELEGDCLSELPKDPFSGRDYVYKVRGDDWILYSVWDNLRDDGGAGRWPHKVSDDKDLIWRNTRLPVD